MHRKRKQDFDEDKNEGITAHKVIRFDPNKLLQKLNDTYAQTRFDSQRDIHVLFELIKKIEEEIFKNIKEAIGKIEGMYDGLDFYMTSIDEIIRIQAIFWEKFSEMHLLIKVKEVMVNLKAAPIVAMNKAYQNFLERFIKLAADMLYDYRKAARLRADLKLSQFFYYANKPATAQEMAVFLQRKEADLFRSGLAKKYELIDAREVDCSTRKVVAHVVELQEMFDAINAEHKIFYNEVLSDDLAEMEEHASVERYRAHKLQYSKLVERLEKNQAEFKLLKEKGSNDFAKSVKKLLEQMFFCDADFYCNTEKESTLKRDFLKLRKRYIDFYQEIYQKLFNLFINELLIFSKDPHCDSKTKAAIVELASLARACSFDKEIMIAILLAVKMYAEKTSNETLSEKIAFLDDIPFDMRMPEQNFYALCHEEQAKEERIKYFSALKDYILLNAVELSAITIFSEACESVTLDHDLHPAPLYKIAFRGDARPPSEIMKYGFLPFVEGGDRVYEGGCDGTERDSSVCASWRMSVATLFPRDNATKTWIYIINVDVTSAGQDEIFQSKVRYGLFNKDAVDAADVPFVNVHSRQVLDVMEEKNNPALRLLYGDEFAVRAVEPKNIICAVQCQRKFSAATESRDMLLRKYILDDNIVMQDSSVLNKNISPARLQSIKEYLQKEIELSKSGKDIPRRNSGYEKQSMASAVAPTFS